MKRIHFVIIILFLLSLVWAMYERNSKTNLVEKVQKLEVEYLKSAKDCEFLKDKEKSLEEKVALLSKNKDELSKTLESRDEYISSLEQKLKDAQGTITDLQARIKKLENLITGLQESSGVSSEK